MCSIDIKTMQESLKQADEAVLISYALLHRQGICQPFSCVCGSLCCICFTADEIAKKSQHSVLENTLLGGLFRGSCSLNENKFGALTENSSKPTQML